MANVKISDLPTSAAVTSADVLPVVQAGVTKKLSFANFLTSPTLFGSGVSTFFASPSSTTLRAILPDATGTGAAVFETGATLNSPTLNSPTTSGNLSFSGTAQRITGDFSNGTHANRVLFQSSTVNGNTGIGAIPNGTATTGSFAVFNSSNPANASLGQFAATATDVRIASTVTGTGSQKPFKVFVGGGEQASFGDSSTLRSLGSFATNTPPLLNVATYTVLVTDYSLRFSTTNCTITLPNPASFPGRHLIITNVTANSVTSASSNVIPLGSNTAGTAILAATAGKFAFLQSDGTSWVTLMAN